MSREGHAGGIDVATKPAHSRPPKRTRRYRPRNNL